MSKSDSIAWACEAMSTACRYWPSDSIPNQYARSVSKLCGVTITVRNPDNCLQPVDGWETL